MKLDEDRYYRALLERDARFDGVFIAAVRTTGIYCRPICPARKPLRKNTVFFPDREAAVQAGFRACLRCRPDAVPDSPGALGTEATVRRALRCIAAGDLDGLSVDQLAARLGVGARHLRRLFREQVGRSPRELARARRLQQARKLIDETTLSMTEVALSSGFASVRRFNAAMREAYGCAPSALRP